MAVKITSANRSAICRYAWSLAYCAAISAIEPVRLHLGAAMRAAWSAFRQDRAEGRTRTTMTADYEERYGRDHRHQAREHLKRLLASKAASAPRPVLTPREIMRIVLERRIVDCNDAIANMRSQIDRDVALHGLPKVNDRIHDQIDDFYRERCALRDDLCALKSGGVVLPPARRYTDRLVAGRLNLLRAQDSGLTAKIEELAPVAQGWCEGSAASECVGAAAELERLWDNREELRVKICSAEAAAAAEAARPVQLDLVVWLAAQSANISQPAQQETPTAQMLDLTTAEGLARILVGRSARLRSTRGEPDYTITAVNRWIAPDCNRTRDYIQLERNDRLGDYRKGPKGVYIERIGSSRGPHLETKAGVARWSYGVLCSFGLTQRAVDDLVRALLEPIM